MIPSSPSPSLIAPTATLATWLHERRAMLKAISIGAVTWPLAFAAAWHWWPDPGVAAGERSSYVLQLAAAPALVLLLMISACMRLFDKPSAENPLLGDETKRLKINQRVITNTLEQLAVFVIILGALALRLPAAHLKLLPIAVALWCSGRVMFWIGYHIAPHYRAPGFDWTFLTTLLLAGWFVATLV